MVAPHTRLQRQKSGIYYFRAAVPRDLMRIMGKREIKKSLGTTKLQEARELVIIESARINREFARIRGTTEYVDRQNDVIERGTGDITLGELIDRYFAAPEKQHLSEKTKLDYSGAYKAIKGILGEHTPIDQITRAKCREFQQAIMSLPANATKRFPKMTVLQVVAHARKTNIEPMASSSMNRYISCLSIVLEWACREGMLTVNHARGLLVEERVHLKDRRHPFSAEQLQRIFNSETMVRYRQENHPRFWVPMLALYTGGRLNEICQLHVSDIQEREGILCMVIQDGDGKRLKTAAASRVVPLHPALLAMGFDQVLEKAKYRRQTKLFRLKEGARGKTSDLFSKWFSRYLKEVGAKTDKTCFHSFRHNFRDALRLAKTDRDLVQVLGGWKDKSAGTEDFYGSGYSVTQLFDAIKKLEYNFRLRGTCGG